ncbi:hypothetical protein SLEP1_g25965 [Rubroshorea leprosula]|uniref:Uncharacterized protein n=1 Tax=Rubroshorea leprosula TaxID=152421 RepID=A0AAV5JRQ5_9ROSI|nr:hypothetical protein SLEP1_g25965 [Rubroshorea leprosula]
MATDIPQKLNQYRQKISIAIVASVIIGLLGYVAPRAVDVLTYFWPLLASTAVLLVVTVGFGGLSQLATEAQGEKVGVGLLMDYVAASRTGHIAELQ